MALNGVESLLMLNLHSKTAELHSKTAELHSKTAEFPRIFAATVGNYIVKVIKLGVGRTSG